MNCRGIVAGVVSLAAMFLALTGHSLRGLPEGDEPQLFTDRFRLLIKENGFALEVKSPDGEKSAAISRDWLIPAAEEEAEADNYVSSFRYSTQVTSFPIGNGEVGLHISSFDAMKSGSAQAAAGRDVFLIYAPQTESLRPPNLRLGVTKERVRVMGCFQAKATHFLVGDVNQDGLADLGAVEEELECQESGDVMSGPIYEQLAVRWYVFSSGNWKYDPQFIGQLPESYTDLPLTGTIMSPVDFAGAMTWRTHDPSRWALRKGTRAPYMPAYRKKLIAEDLNK